MTRAQPGGSPLRIAVLDDYLGVALEMAAWSSLPDASVTVFRDPIRPSDVLVERLQTFDVICAMRERTPFTSDVIRALPKLRLLVTTGMKNAAIDLAAARDAGVLVCGTESLLAPTVELTWSLILAAARHVPDSDRSVRDGGWQRKLGISLRGRRLGVIGLGRIGLEVATLGKAFGMDVVAWSQNLATDRPASVGARLVSKEELLETSDVVTIHLQLSDRTRGLLAAADLARMQPRAILVNTSRGPIVAEGALIEALQNRRLAAAALDVYDDEPLPADHPLRQIDNVVLSPHVGYVTEENLRLFYQQTVADIAAFVSGEPIRVVT
jgi:phosphoglycerate dehydrogenase-like enzyme